MKEMYFIELLIKGKHLEFYLSSIDDLLNIIKDLIENEDNDIKIEDYGKCSVPLSYLVKVGE